MTLRLILTRHAKSDWGLDASHDRLRPLNERGKRSARAVGAWLAAQDYKPDLVLASDATRTRETWEHMAESLNHPLRVFWTPALYLAGPSAFLNLLREADDARCVLMLGHNPGIARFANAIVSNPPPHDRFADYPTCATLVARMQAASWKDVTPGCGRTLDFTVPRELTA